MNLSFERVFSNEDKKIYEVYEILRVSGEHMFKEYGLTHWKIPYPIQAIRTNCEEREVFLVKDIDTGTYVHTFQLEFIREYTKPIDTISNEFEMYVANINKFATLPKAAGKGIGKLSMDYIEEYCRHKVSKICLDVYDKSEHAIRFYEKRGFLVTGSKSTRYFTVYIMEKQL